VLGWFGVAVKIAYLWSPACLLIRNARWSV